jgi:hypothetical protein
MQRVLYGNTLDEYIHVELIGLPLVKGVKEKPSLILVRNPLLLRLRPSLSCPVVLVRRDQKAAINTNESDEVELKPIMITSHREFPAEASAAQAMLASLLQRRDLLEPFERLDVALNEAHKQHIGDNSAGGARE